MIKAQNTSAALCFASGLQDLNLRPLGPQPSALPGYAKPRGSVRKCIITNACRKCKRDVSGAALSQTVMRLFQMLFTFLMHRMKQTRCATAVSAQEIGYETYSIRIVGSSGKTV